MYTISPNSGKLRCFCRTMFFLSRKTTFSQTPAPPPPAEDAEIDPFEAFMAEINAVTQQQEAAAGKPSAAGELDAKVRR